MAASNIRPHALDPSHGGSGERFTVSLMDQQRALQRQGSASRWRLARVPPQDLSGSEFRHGAMCAPQQAALDYRLGGGEPDAVADGEGVAVGVGAETSGERAGAPPSPVLLTMTAAFTRGGGGPQGASHGGFAGTVIGTGLGCLGPLT